jgi:hypothetical protein
MSVQEIAQRNVFGIPIGVIREPDLHFKQPFVLVFGFRQPLINTKAGESGPSAPASRY